MINPRYGSRLTGSGKRTLLCGAALLAACSAGPATENPTDQAPPGELDEDAAKSAAAAPQRDAGDPDARAKPAEDAARSGETAPGTDAPVSPGDGTTAPDGAGVIADASRPDFSLPSGWSPRQLANLSFWLSAGNDVVLEGDKIATWRDLGPNHNDAAQSRATQRPTLAENVVNGHPAVRFAKKGGLNLMIPDSASLQWGAGDFTVAVVFSHTTQPVAGSHLGGWAMFLNKITQPSGGRKGWGLMANWPTSETTPVKTVIGCETHESGGLMSKRIGYNDGKMRLWTMHRVTAQKVVQLRRNGTVDSKTSEFLDDVDLKGNPVTIGGMRGTPTSAGVSFGMDGDIAEIVAVKGPLTDVDLANLEGYLMKKYALSD